MARILGNLARSGFCIVPLVTSAAAQEAAESHSAAVIGRSFGAYVDGGQIGAVGPRYIARFGGGGIELTPALGERAPRNYPVSFVLESIRRGDRVLVESPRPADPVREGNFVRYARGAGIVESYESRVDGVEQTFFFESLPAGTGDLIVRGRLATELPHSSGEHATGGLRFEIPDVGGVSWGSVTAIDAQGTRVRGSLHFDGRFLDLTLEGELVDRATFPLLLDPLIGPIFAVSGTGQDYDPDVAYDATNDVYLAVWHRRFSASTRVILAQRFLSTGMLVGPSIPLTTTPGNHYSPAVANVSATDSFVVAYTEAAASFSVKVRVLAAATGSLSNEYTLVSQLPISPMEPKPDVGGNNLGVPFAVVVFSYSGTIAAVQVTLGANISYGPILWVSPPSVLDDRSPAITRNAGSGRLLVTWERETANGGNDLYARMISLAAMPLMSETPVATDPVADEANPDCATPNGTDFAIVYERRNLGPNGIADIACRTATFSLVPGSLAISSEQILAGRATFDEIEPAIDFAASKYLVAWAWASLFGSGWNLSMVGLDRQSGFPCEPVTPIDSSSSTTDRFPEIAAKYGGSSSAGDEAVVVWESTATSTNVKAQRVEAIGAGGAVTSLGGGCGGGGTADVNGPVALGNSAFAFTLSGAAGPAASLVLGASRLNLACGSCTIVPALDLVLPGSAPFRLPIACDGSLLGATLYAQWIVLAPSDCPLAPALSFSGALSVVIGL